MSELRRQSAAALRRLVDWAASMDARSIPTDVLRRAALVLADDLGAIVGARDEPEVRCFHEWTLARRCAPEATVFRGGRQRTGGHAAAVANGVAAAWIELDEGYRPTSCHGGLYAVPALLAEAETRNLPYLQMLRALALSYEITTRLARAWKLQRPNIQPHGRFAAIGAAAAVALARPDGARLLEPALGTAITLSGLSPRSHLAEGTLSRNVWPAAGAWSGMMAVEWADCGIGGALTAFHDGYTDLLGGTLDASVLTEALGEYWGIRDGYTKIHACCQHLHSAVEAALALRSELPPGAGAQIDVIEVTTHPLGMLLLDSEPRTTLGAKFSMPHAIAAALVTGSSSVEAFDRASLDDAAIRALRPRVKVGPYAPLSPPPNDRPSRVRIRLEDGREFVQECLSAIGGPDRPLPPDTVMQKVEALAGPVYPHMREVLEDLSTLAPNPSARGWADIVEEFA